MQSKEKTVIKITERELYLFYNPYHYINETLRINISKEDSWKVWEALKKERDKRAEKKRP